MRGTKPERWVRQTDFTNDEAVGFLADRLNRLGVEDKLLELGAEEGDAVLIGEAENAVVFDFRPMVSTGAELLGRRGEDARLEEPSVPRPQRRREIDAAMAARGRERDPRRRGPPARRPRPATTPSCSATTPTGAGRRTTRATTRRRTTRT